LKVILVMIGRDVRERFGTDLKIHGEMAMTMVARETFTAKCLSY
jgi:hypothetical protein